MLKQFKLWKSLVEINPKNLTIQAISYIVCLICALVSPVALSLFISHISSAEFTLALLWLGIDLAIKLLEQLSWHFNYSNYTRLIAPTYLSLREKLTTTILKPIEENKKLEFDYVVSNDLYTISAYIDRLLYGISNIIKFLIITIIIFYYSYSIGTIILAVSILGYFILSFYMGQRKKANKRLYDKELSVTKKFDEIQEKKNIIKKYNLENAVIYEGNRRLYDYVESYQKATTNRSFKDNLLRIYWYFMLAVCLVILVYEFRNATLTLTLFLTIYNYLLMYIRITENVFDFKLEFSELKLALGRFNNVINIEKEIEKQIITEIKEVEVPKYSARANAKEKSVSIPIGSVAVFKNTAYKELFTLPPADFKIDNIDISHLDYHSVCKFISYENEMFDDSIIENLQIINPDLKKVSNVVKLVGLSDFIDALQDKEFSNISNNTDISINFKFNLAKAILSDSSVIFADVSRLSDEDLSRVLKAIIIMKENRIFMIFDKDNRINRKKILIVE